MEFRNFCCCWSISPTCSTCTFSTRCRSALQICTRLVQYYFESTANFQGHPTSSCEVTTSLSQIHQQQQHTSRYSPRNFGVSDLNNCLWDFVHSRNNLLGLYLFYSLLYLYWIALDLLILHLKFWNFRFWIHIPFLLLFKFLPPFPFQTASYHCFWSLFYSRQLFGWTLLLLIFLKQD